MDTPITIRPVRPPEFEVAGQIVLAAYDGAGTIEGPYRQRLADTGGRVAEGSEVWVALSDGTVIGTVTFTDTDDPNFEDDGHGDCGFRMLGVAPWAQGRGAGRALVQVCIDTASRRGRHRLAIYSMIWMTTAHALYASMGFTRRADRDLTFPAGIGWAFEYNLTTAASSHFPVAGPRAVPPPWYLDVL